MSKTVDDYIRDCLLALGQSRDDDQLGGRIREVQQYWEQMWGGAVPASERIFAGFISNKQGSHEPSDLWYFTEHHCLVARELSSPQLDLLVFPFEHGIKRMRIGRNYRQRPQIGAKLAVALWFDDESKGVLEASDANCVPLETLIKEVLVPKLRS